MSIIKAEINKKVIMSLDIDERITFIGGDSGSGKTLITEVMRDISNNPGILKIEGITEEQIVVFATEQEVNNLEFSRKVVFIDRYDTYSLPTKQKLWRKMSKLDNTWIIMTRKPDIPKNYGFSIRSFKELKTQTHSNGVTTLYLSQKN